MATLCQGALWQKFQFFVKNGIFLLLNVVRSDFFGSKRNQRLRIDNCTTFQLNWTEDKGTRILIWNNTKNGLMTSNLPHSDDVIKIFLDFEIFCPRLPSCQIWL